MHNDAEALHRKRPKVAFHRTELSPILDTYGRMVISGEAKDYAIGMGRDLAVFEIYRRASERATWTVEKVPALANRQGQYAVRGSEGQVLKRGRDLKQVLRVLDRKGLRVV